MDPTEPPAEKLSELRAEMARVDQEILEAFARRQRLASEIGRAKMTGGRATRDFSQEKQVIGRARGKAESMGLPGDVAERMMLLLIEASLAVQERDRVSHEGTGNGRRVLIIGGAGKMGRWFARFLDSQGFDITVADPAGPVAGFAHDNDWTQVELDHDIIVVATPMPATAKILNAMAASPPAGVVFDLGSLKSPLRDGLHALQRAGGRVTSVHPMFGPSTELLSGRHVIFVDVGCAEATEVARALFAATMAVQVDMDLESHDRLIAYVLGLSHAVNIAFVTALADSGEGAKRLAKLSSTTFDNQLNVARAVSQENPHLYFEIQSLNDYGTESLSALLYAVERIRSVIRAGDEEGFVALMQRGDAYLQGR